MSTPTPSDPAWQTALSALTSALRRVATGTIPPELDRRYLDLGERKRELTDDERAELHAWVAFTQARSAEKLSAELALRRLAGLYPSVADSA